MAPTLRAARVRRPPDARAAEITTQPATPDDEPLPLTESYALSQERKHQEQQRQQDPLHLAPFLHRRQPASTTATSVFAAVKATTVVEASVQTSIVPAGYGLTKSGPSAGTVVGITLGSAGGFLLLMALLYTCFNVDGRNSVRGLFLGGGGGSVVETASSFGGAASYVSRREDRRARRHHRHHRRHGERETVEIRTGGSRARPIIVEPPGVGRVFVEEERIRRTSRPPPGATVVESVDEDDEIVVEEEDIDYDRRRRRQQRRRDEDDDEVVVIEENSSPPPRRESRRNRSSRGGDSAGPSRRSSRRDSRSGR